MRVVLEVNSVLHDRHSGFFTYGAGLLEGLAGLGDRCELTLLCGGNLRGRSAWLEGLDERLGACWATLPIKPRVLGWWWRGVSWPTVQAFTGAFDVYHCLHHFVGPTRGRPRLLTVHDLRRYRFPQFYPRSKPQPFEHAVRHADHFIAVSHATRRDLQEIFDVPDEHISVVYHGGPRLAGPAAAGPAAQPVLLQRFGLRPGRFFAVFSSYDRRKNVLNIVQGFALAATRLEADFRLAVVGRLPEDFQLQRLEAPGLAQRIVCTGPLDQVAPLLTHATGLVYASLYEGFGLPILEAMAAGCPVITSNCSSMPEVAGPAALLVDPADPEQIAQAILTLAHDAGARQRLTTAGQARCREFSWRRAAAETLAVYRRLV